MNDLARQQLCEIIAAHGRDLVDDPKRIRALLSDLCPGQKREVHLVVAAVEQRIVAELLSSSANVPWPVVSGRLVRRMIDELGVAEDAARWTVDTWGIALEHLAGSSLVPSFRQSGLAPVAPPAQAPVFAERARPARWLIEFGKLAALYVVTASLISMPYILLYHIGLFRVIPPGVRQLSSAIVMIILPAALFAFTKSQQRKRKTQTADGVRRTSWRWFWKWLVRPVGFAVKYEFLRLTLLLILGLPVLAAVRGLGQFTVEEMRVNLAVLPGGLAILLAVLCPGGTPMRRGKAAVLTVCLVGLLVAWLVPSGWLHHPWLAMWRPVNQYGTITYSPDGMRLAVGYDNGGGGYGHVRLLNPQDGRLLTEFEVSNASHLAFSRDGTRLLISSESELFGAVIYDTTTWTKVKGFPGTAVSISPNGMRVAFFDAAEPEMRWHGGINVLKIAETTTGEVVWKLGEGKRKVLSTAFSPSGMQLVSGSYDGAVELWDVKQGSRIHTCLKHTGGVSDAQFSADGARIVSGSNDGTVCVWDATTGKLLHSLTWQNCAVKCVTFSPDGRKIVAGGAVLDEARKVSAPEQPTRGGVKVWETDTGIELVTIYEPDTWWDTSSAFHGMVDAMSFSPDGTHMAISQNGRPAILVLP